ncbi:helix-turn-helix domain-containing protein [Nocardia brasiliensis]|uniref:helix-turn-helix domain-containing protein n=1 Tax=Nocardia brasiliensis TaxID=37326 RepID=UPI003D92B282
MQVLADRGEHQRGDFEVQVGPSTLSHHMKTLREAGLTRHRMEGTRCFVSLREDTLGHFPAILEAVLQAVAAEE